MATEAALTDQEPIKQSEEIKVDDDIKLVDSKSVSVSENAELKDEGGNFKVEDSASPETLVSETEEKPEDRKIDTTIEEVKKEEINGGEIIEKESESTNLEKTIETSEASLVQVSETEAAKDPTVSEAVAEAAETKEPPPDSVTEEAETKEPPSDSVTTEAEAKEASSDSVTEEVKTKELPPASETEDTKTEETIATAVEPVPKVIVAPDASGIAEISNDENFSAEVEVSPDPSTEAPIATAVEPVPEVIVAPVDSGIAEISKDEKVSAEVEVSPDPSNEAPIATDVEPVPEVIVAPDASRSAEISQDENISAEVEVSPDPSNEEPASQETPVEEIAALDSSNSVDVVTTEVSEVQDDVTVSPEVPDCDIVDSKKQEASSGKTLKLEEPAEVKKNEDSPVEEVKIVSETTKPEPAAEIYEPASEGVIGKVEENIGDSLQGDTTTLVENSKDLDIATEVAKVPTSEENASGNKEEVEDKSLEGDKPALIETSRNIDLDSTSKETTSDTKETEAQVKPAEGTQTLSDKFANEGLEDDKDVNKEANDAKDGSGTKTEGEAPKQEAPIKSSQRHSNNILSKVKQSIVKVKKAIIGKSASSKTMTAEGKGAIKV